MPVPNRARMILGVLCLSATLAAGCVFGGEEPPAETGAPRSPRLATLAAEVRKDRGAGGRFWEEIGKRGTPLVEPAPADASRALGDGPSLLDANHRLAEVLRARGYEVLFSEYSGGHGYANWQGTIADGLIFLLKR